MMQIIDPHIHLFDLKLGEYHWLKPGNPPFWPDKNIINQNFNENDLQLDNETTLAGFVHIEAGFNNLQPWREIQWLEEHCRQPFRSIAAIDLSLSNKEFNQAIESIKQYSSVVGVRDILNDNALTYLSSKQVKSNLQKLATYGLIFELQMPLENVTAVDLLVNFLTVNKNLQIVINHAGFPPYVPCLNEEKAKGVNNMAVDERWKNWQQAIVKLSLFEQCSIKCSGFEMANRNFITAWQMNVIQTCLASFKNHRVMLGSNFPLCLFSKSYQESWQQYREVKIFTPKELAALCLLNAQRIYKF